MFSPQMRDVAGVEPSPPIFFTLRVPHRITGLLWITKFPLKHEVLVPSRPTYMGSGLKQQITITKTCCIKSHLEEEGKCKFSILLLFWLWYPSCFSSEEEAVGLSSWLLLLSTSLVCHAFPWRHQSWRAHRAHREETLQNRRKCLLETLFYHIAQIPENT